MTVCRYCGVFFVDRNESMCGACATKVCKVCGTFQCDNHIGWTACSCGTTYDGKTYLRCPDCNPDTQNYRPALQETCCACCRPLQADEIAYVKRGVPGSSICLRCGDGPDMNLQQYAHWPLFCVVIGKFWTVEELEALEILR